MIAGSPQALRWAACFALALGFHGAGAAALLARWNDSADLVANAPLIMIDLAPVAAAPATTPTEWPPDTVESKLVEPTPEPEPPPPRQIELPPDPAPQPELTATPPPKPVGKKVEKKKPRQREASIARAPSAVHNKADRAAAPMPGASARDSNALPNWTSKLVAQIARHKRYPEEARARGETGTTQVAFRVDRSGGVHNVRVVRSSGSSLLDSEALAWVERSQPLPPPPAEIPDAKLNIDLPLRYSLR